MQPRHPHCRARRSESRPRLLRRAALHAPVPTACDAKQIRDVEHALVRGQPLAQMRQRRVRVELVEQPVHDRIDDAVIRALRAEERRWPRTKRIGRAPASRVLRGVPPATSAASRRQLASSSSRSRAAASSAAIVVSIAMSSTLDAMPRPGVARVVLLVEDLQTPTDQ